MRTLPFITEQQFVEHVTATIQKYGEKLNSYNLEKFNSNLIDPIKLLFDKNVYQLTWDEVVKNEISRQRDKSNNNDIGYFHQNIFSYIEHCEVPATGWDVIYSNPKGICLPDGSTVSTVFVEMKNKHNTMNSAASGKTYIKMQSELLNNDDCACFLVEAIAKKSQNITWEISVDAQKKRHKRIRRVSMDNFYAMVTGIEDAFFQVCMALPETIKAVVEKSAKAIVPRDTAISELKNIAKNKNLKTEDLSIAMAVYMLGFGSYLGFTEK